jgi:hypothetical protein
VGKVENIGFMTSRYFRNRKEPSSLESLALALALALHNFKRMTDDDFISTMSSSIESEEEGGGNHEASYNMLHGTSATSTLGLQQEL